MLGVRVLQPNEYGLTSPESKSRDQSMAISMEAPDSRIGSDRDQIAGRTAAARIVDWSPIRKWAGSICSINPSHNELKPIPNA